MTKPKPGPDEPYRPGQTVDGKLICGGRNKSTGEPCRLPPIPGGKRCARAHGGRQTKTRRKAAERVALKDSLQKMGKAVDMGTLGEPVDVDPAEAFMDEIRWTAGHVAWLRNRVRELDPEALTWGTVSQEKGQGEKGYKDISTLAAAPAAIYAVYLTERQHLVRVCAAALKAGVEERRIKLAEDQGQLVALVVRDILARLNLTPEQERLVPVIVPEALRALTAGDP